jgi:hypothetical protein
VLEVVPDTAFAQRGSAEVPIRLHEYGVKRVSNSRDRCKSAFKVRLDPDLQRLSITNGTSGYNYKTQLTNPLRQSDKYRKKDLNMCIDLENPVKSTDSVFRQSLRDQDIAQRKVMEHIRTKIL